MPETVPRTEPPRDTVITVPVKLCACGALPGECDCAQLAVQMESAPLLVIRTGRYR